MRFRLLTGLTVSCVLATAAVAQGPGQPLGHTPKPGVTTELPATAASVGPNDPVITLSTTCKPETAGCLNKVTREQFEKMADAIKPGMTTDQRRNFAQAYGKLLVFSDQARALGLQNDPKFKQLLDFATDQILVQTLQQYYSDQYSHPSEQDIQNYYNQNIKKYVQANLQRIIIPAEPATAEAKKPTEAEQKAYIEQLRKRWVDGGDPVALQKEAIERMGLSSSPDVNLLNQRPNTFPPDQESVFSLKPGDVSQPFVDPGATFLYKMVSVQQIPFNDVKSQIAKTIHDQGLREKIQQLDEAAKLTMNEAYFGPEKQGPTAASVEQQQQGTVVAPAPQAAHPAPPDSANTPK